MAAERIENSFDSSLGQSSEILPLPRMNSTLIDAPIVDDEHEPAVQPRHTYKLHVVEGNKQATKKKPKQRRNYTADGRIDTTKQREGKDKTDTYGYRRKMIRQKCQELHRLTGAPIEITIKKLTDRGRDMTYKTDNFDNWIPKSTLRRQSDADKNETVEYDEELPEEESEEQQESEEEPVMFSKITTPSKRFSSNGSAGSSKQNVNAKVTEASRKTKEANCCKICRNVSLGKEDMKKNCRWVRCGRAYCRWWVHSKCVNVHYFNDDLLLTQELEKWAQDHFFCPTHRPSEDRSSDEEEIAPKGARLRKIIKSITSTTTRK